MKTVNSIIMRLLGVLLLAAAVLKGWQLLAEPVANKDIWTYRPLLVLMVEFELALGIWLLSGLFKKAAWLAALLCFSAFSIITLYKGLTGAESCGCFGTVHVNPWITLLAIDVPAVILLALFRRPRSEKLLAWPSLTHFATTAALGVIVLAVTTPIMLLNEPAPVTSSYEVLEPETWVGKKLPILEHIDIADLLKEGLWLVLFYHYDCPDCARAIRVYENIAREVSGNEGFVQIAFVEVPPYGQGPVSPDSPCVLGRLANVKEWFLTTPAVALLEDGRTKRAWEGQAPPLETIIESIALGENRTDPLGGATGIGGRNF
ncbi:MAG: hypothetical protein JSU94_09175 [Phycisphaerales bacterium]|nr:MAG: hypothetical protein JSU94_09175 [Phycisphaerales bacterium]